MKETKEPIKIKLTVAVVLFIIFLLVIGMLGMFVYYNSNSKKNEAIELFNKYAFFYIDLKKDINNVDEIKQKIMQLRYVKSVEIDSNEGKLDEYNSMRNKYRSAIYFFEDDEKHVVENILLRLKQINNQENN